MEANLTVLYYLLVAVALIQAFLLGMQTWEHRRFARSSMSGLDRHRPEGRALVCIPCKGSDLNLEDNLRALMEQDYSDYEVAFIVENESDSSVPVIRKVMAEHLDVSARLVVAGPGMDCGQKVHNLRAATSRISDKISYLAFLDSDARPRPEWLRILISRLDRPDVGAVTGYRWLIPQASTFANHILYSLNCEIMALLGRSSHHLIWGGSWAIRREVFELLGIRSAWRNTVSDDLIASRLLSESGLKVRFEPACVVASPINDTMANSMAFVRRQYLLGKIYIRKWWFFAILGFSFTSLLWLGNLGVLAWSLLRGGISPCVPALVAVLLYLARAYRGRVRQQVADCYFPHLAGKLSACKRFDIWMNPWVGFLHWAMILSSIVGRRIHWRGIGYELSYCGKIKSIWREDIPITLPIARLPRQQQVWRQGRPERATSGR